MLRTKLSNEILAAAMEGFQAQRNRIETRMTEIRLMLDRGGSEPAAASKTTKPRKKRSAAVRRRMKIAQQLRWKKIKEAAVRLPSKAAKPKRRKLSAGRRDIIVATKKGSAAVKAAKQAEKPVVAKKSGRKGTKKTVKKAGPIKPKTVVMAHEQPAAAGA